MEISLRFGQGEVQANLPHSVRRVDRLETRRQSLDPVSLALAAPIGSPPLRQLVKPGQKVAIVTSDITRPCPSWLLLPPLLDELNQAGVQDDDVLVVFALGTHRRHTAEEQVRLLGPDVARRVAWMDSDPDDVITVGTTSRGTVIEAFRPVVEADFRIAVGHVEPHYFAGYSGGAKALVPGVCSLTTIRQNHALMVSPAATTCQLDGNPVRDDIEEGAALIGLDFILNVVLDRDHQIVAAAAGHPQEAHRYACRVVDYLNAVTIESPADIVVVSAGGYPKDLNLYQAQKALDNAAAAVRPGGVIVWVAECSEGLGNAIFEEWLIGSQPDEILSRLQRQFVLGGHKAGALARVLKKAQVILVSSLPSGLVESCGITQDDDLDSALETAFAQVGPDPVVALMPEGTRLVAKVVEQALLQR